MDKFAKLYEFDDIGQVLVTLDMDEEEDTSQVNFRVSYKGLRGDKTLSYEEGEKGFSKAEKRFELATKENAYEVAKGLTDVFDEIFGDSLDD